MKRILNMHVLGNDIQRLSVASPKTAMGTRIQETTSETSSEAEDSSAMKRSRWLQYMKISSKRRPYRLNRFCVALFVSLITILALYVALRQISASFSKARLTLTGNNTLHIAVFSDLHYGENEDSFGLAQDVKSTALMHRVLDIEKPDFVVLNGDLITGENTFAFNSTKYLDEIVAPLAEGGYQWACTYGNHDSKYNLSREALFREEKKHAGSHTEHGPVDTDGVTNYVLPIFSAGNGRESKKPVALLWFFDSRGGAEYQHEPANQDNIPNHVSNRTVLWFRSKQEILQHQYGILPSLAFVHIPFKAFLDTQQQTSPIVSGPYYPGLNDDVPLAQQGYSNTGSEAVPFMKALLDTPGLHSVYSAHDHGDSWCGRWSNETLPGYGVGGGSSQERPFLCFCKHSGWGGYGNWRRGVRQVKLAFDENGKMQVNTWVRMQGGDVITAVSLNETYGEDRYPTYDGEGREDPS